MSITKEQVAMREKWVKALRSGKYEQTTGMLRGRGAFCCIGVACDVVDPTKWGTNTSDVYVPYGGFCITNWDNEMADKYGIKYEDSSELMGMNDNKGDSFDTIADAIELITLADMED